MIRIVCALLVLALTALPASAAIRSHGTLQSCMVTIGNFCPIESIGISLLGTAAIAAVLFGLGVVWRLLTGASARRPARLPQHVSSPPNYAAPARKQVNPLRFAKVQNLMSIGDYDAAATAIGPFVQAGDAGATPLYEEIVKRLND